MDDFHVSAVCNHANVCGMLVCHLYVVQQHGQKEQVHLQMLCYPEVQEVQLVQEVQGDQLWSKLPSQNHNLIVTGCLISSGIKTMCKLR